MATVKLQNKGIQLPLKNLSQTYLETENLYSAHQVVVQINFSLLCSFFY